MLTVQPLGSRWLCASCFHHARLSRCMPTSVGRQAHPLARAMRERPLTASSRSLATALTETDRTRNIGIIAHIDAGKTTTTERMLYYSGYTRAIGDVDDGSTVTDFLPAERARGITIQSAAITFQWPPATSQDTSPSSLDTLTVEQLREQALPLSSVPHNINLIDTPGHADFTFEVLRSLRILDGAVCVLDGVAGVEAQTEKVWTQADKYDIPRIIFVNKLDRQGAAFGRTVREVAHKLAGWPAVCQIPWYQNGHDGRLQGIGDAIGLRGLFYEAGSDGKRPLARSLAQLEETDPAFAETLKQARIALVELLSEQDDQLVECFLEKDGDHLAVGPLEIIDSLRRCLRNPTSRVIPVFAGASFKNIGVQPLLDAVVNLLPSPAERSSPEITIGQTKGELKGLLDGTLRLGNPPSDASSAATKRKAASAVPVTALKKSLAKLEACALAFKVVHDAKRGPLVHVRVYSGELTRNAALFNTALQTSERGPRLLRMYADNAVEVPSVKAGNIAAITGLKLARTGDTLLQYPGNKPVPPYPLNTLQLRPIDVPPAVFFASVEPNSLSEEKSLNETLALLLREDPSLHVTHDEESGQTLLSGMGELHLEIARDRLIKDLKAKASMGNITIGYRVCVSDQSPAIHRVWDKEVAGRKGKAGCTAMVQPLEHSCGHESGQPDGVWASQAVEGNRVTIICPVLGSACADSAGSANPLPGHLDQGALRSALINGATAALSRGPSHALPMHETHVCLTFDPSDDLFGTDSSPQAISAAARTATTAALKEVAGSATLMEPVMSVTISVPEESMGSVIHDISSARGGHILSLDGDADAEGETAKNETEQARLALPPIDLKRVWAPKDSYGAAPSATPSSQGQANVRQIKAQVPLKEMVGYLKHLRSLTSGRGTFVMSVDRFHRMSGQRVKALLAEWNEA